MNKYLDYTGLTTLVNKIKELIPTVFGSSGTNHSSGLVPDPGATQGTTKFLREDGTWQVPASGGTTFAYGTSSTGAATVQKEVSIPSITSLETGQIIHVKPSTTSTVANSTIKLNSFTAYPIRYNNAAITTSTDSIVWNANYISSFLFDGTYWQFIGHGLDSNTTYSTLALADGKTGTATAAKTISASVLKSVIIYHSSPAIITKASGTTLSAEINTYYRFNYNVGTLTITLPSVSEITRMQGMIFSFKTGASPAVTFASTGNITISYQTGYSIETSTEYEINAIYNGSKWILTYATID